MSEARTAAMRAMHVVQFVGARCLRSPSYRVSRTTLYADYTEWARHAAPDAVLPDSHLAEILRSMGFRRSRRHWLGLTVRTRPRCRPVGKTAINSQTTP